MRGLGKWIRRNARELGAYVVELAKIAWKAVKPIVVEVAVIIATDLFEAAVTKRPRPA